jgi:hypothetical protein
MAAPTRTPRSTWIEEGLRALAAGGPDAVRIEPLAKALGDARAKLRRAGALTFSEELLPIDLAVRAWSRLDPAVAERLRRVDNRRMDYLRILFGTFCSDPAEVEARSMLAFSLMIGNHFMAADHGELSRAQVLELTAGWLLA